MAKATTKPPVEKQITDYMDEKGISDKELGLVLGKSKTHIHFVFRCRNKSLRRPLTQQNLDAINKAWNKKFKLSN